MNLIKKKKKKNIYIYIYNSKIHRQNMIYGFYN